MNGCVMNTYFFLEVLEKLPKQIQDDLCYTDSLCFNFSNFMFVPKFSYVYNLFKKDPYELDKKFEENFMDFFIECAIHLNQKNDYKRLLFLYGLLSTYTLREFYNPYIQSLKDESESMDKIYNMLDYFYATVKQIDLTKTSLYKLYPDAFTYYNYMEDLIHNPLIRTYKFMGSRGYFKKSYKRFKHYCKKDSANRMKKPLHILFDKLFARKKPGKEYFLYEPYSNPDLITFQKKKIDNNGVESYEDLESIRKKAIDEAVSRIEALNDYLFNHKENQFRKKFQISEEKKL